MNTAQETYEHYNEISRHRALTLIESRALERAIRELDKVGIAKTSEWTVAEDKQLMKLRNDGLSYEQIAIALTRSKSACAGRYRKINSINVSKARQAKITLAAERAEEMRFARLSINETFRKKMASLNG